MRILQEMASEEIASRKPSEQDIASARILVNSQFKRNHDDAFFNFICALLKSAAPHSLATTQSADAIVQISLTSGCIVELLGAARNAAAALATLCKLPAAAPVSGGLSTKFPALVHGRTWWDAPEFHPIVRTQSASGESSTRIGLWFDDCSASATCVVKVADGTRPAQYHIAGDSLASALLSLVDKGGAAATAAGGGSKRSRPDSMSAALCTLHELANMESEKLEHGTQQLRRKACAGECWDGMGVTVSRAGSGSGWRPLQCTEKKLVGLLKQNGTPAELSELFHFAHIANDERDFGMPLSLGRAVWRLSERHTTQASALLCTSYDLMGRSQNSKLTRKLAKLRGSGAFGTPPASAAGAEGGGARTADQSAYSASAAGLALDTQPGASDHTAASGAAEGVPPPGTSPASSKLKRKSPRKS